MQSFSVVLYLYDYGKNSAAQYNMQWWDEGCGVPCKNKRLPRSATQLQASSAKTSSSATFSSRVSRPGFASSERDRVVQTSRLGKIIQTLPSLASDWLVARWTTNQRAGNCEGHLSSARTKSFTRKDEVCISDGEMSPSTRMVWTSISALWSPITGLWSEHEMFQQFRLHWKMMAKPGIALTVHDAELDKKTQFCLSG